VFEGVQVDVQGLPQRDSVVLATQRKRRSRGGQGGVW